MRSYRYSPILTILTPSGAESQVRYTKPAAPQSVSIPQPDFRGGGGGATPVKRVAYEYLSTNIWSVLLGALTSELFKVFTQSFEPQATRLMDQMAGFKIIIVGGGLSGALLANGLRNNNINFMVYERDDAESNREGYQIRLGDGARAGFEACLTRSQIAAIDRKLGKSSTSSATAPSLYTSRFTELLDLSTLHSYAKSAAMNRVVLRDLLMEPIKKDKQVIFGKSFVKYELITEEDGSEKVKIHFGDSSHDTCDILVGADGANSRVRNPYDKQSSINDF